MRLHELAPVHLASSSSLIKSSFLRTVRPVLCLRPLRSLVCPESSHGCFLFIIWMPRKSLLCSTNPSYLWLLSNILYSVLFNFLSQSGVFFLSSFIFLSLCIRMQYPKLGTRPFQYHNLSVQTDRQTQRDTYIHRENFLQREILNVCLLTE